MWHDGICLNRWKQWEFQHVDEGQQPARCDWCRETCDASDDTERRTPQDSNNEDDYIPFNFSERYADEFLIRELGKDEAVRVDHQVVAGSYEWIFWRSIGRCTRFNNEEFTVKVVGFIENVKFSVSPVLSNMNPNYQEILIDQVTLDIEELRDKYPSDLSGAER